MTERIDGRMMDQLRPVKITPSYLEFAEGSAFIEMGRTRVLCSVSVEDRVPPFLRGQNQGWVTAEYSMLPRATPQRTTREATQGRVGGRTHEVQRLIGRSLRAVTDLKALGERSFFVDCDVIQADGGTRTAAITGAYVALWQAMDRLVKQESLATVPLRWAVGAVSVGIVAGQPMLDLCYEEDSAADVDFNVVMTSNDDYVEVQGTAERQPFSRAAMDELTALAHTGIRELFVSQEQAIKQLT